MRNLKEFQATKHLFSLIIWIDASRRVPELESSKTFNIDQTNAHIVVTNNGTTEELKEKALALCKMFIYS